MYCSSEEFYQNPRFLRWPDFTKSGCCHFLRNMTTFAHASQSFNEHQMHLICRKTTTELQKQPSSQCFLLIWIIFWPASALLGHCRLCTNNAFVLFLERGGKFAVEIKWLHWVREWAGKTSDWNPTKPNAWPIWDIGVRFWPLFVLFTILRHPQKLWCTVLGRAGKGLSC